MQTEGEIQRDIVKYLELKDFLVYRMNSGKARYNIKLSPPGTPDLLCISPAGRIIWIEVKTETGKVSKVQLEMHEKLWDRKQVVIVARCLDDVRGLQ